CGIFFALFGGSARTMARRLDKVKSYCLTTMIRLFYRNDHPEAVALSWRARRAPAFRPRCRGLRGDAAGAVDADQGSRKTAGRRTGGAASGRGRAHRDRT